MKDRIIKVERGELLAPSIGRMEKQFSRFLAEDPKREITFLFEDCSGGHAELVLDFVSLIRGSGAPIRTLNRGSIRSSAVFLFLAGDKREGTKGCSFQLHPFTVNPKEIRITRMNADFAVWKSRLKKLFVRVAKLIREKTRLSTDEIERIFSDDTSCFDHDDAARYGLITEPAKEQA